MWEGGEHPEQPGSGMAPVVCHVCAVSSLLQLWLVLDAMVSRLIKEH